MGVYTNYLQESAVQAVNEAYFGLNNEIKECIYHLSNYRKKFISAVKYSEGLFGGLKSKVSNDPDLFKFNRAMENAFGFENFSLLVDPKGIRNGFTVAMPVRVKNPKAKFKPTKNGFKYDKSDGCVCVVYMYSGLIFDSKFTDNEIMAIIIHEVGHNFSYMFDKSIVLTTNYFKLLKLPILIYSYILGTISLVLGDIESAEHMYACGTLHFEKLTDLFLKIRKQIYADPILSFFADIFFTISNTKINIDYTIKTLIMPLLVPLFAAKYLASKLRNVLTIDGLLFYVSGYKNEKIADNFPTMYGLGPDLSSALVKIERVGPTKSTQLVKETPVIGWIYDILMMPLTIIGTVLDVHPETTARVINQQKYLKEELKKSNLDPKMKAELSKNLAESDKVIADMKKLNITNGTLVGDMYAFIMADLFGGDVRQALSDIAQQPKDKYNKKFDDVINNAKIN